MEEDRFYEAEHFYNDDTGVAESGVDEVTTEDLSNMGYFELAKRFLGKRELPKLEKDISTSDFPEVNKNIYVQVCKAYESSDMIFRYRKLQTCRTMRLLLLERRMVRFEFGGRIVLGRS